MECSSASERADRRERERVKSMAEDTDAHTGQTATTHREHTIENFFATTRNQMKPNGSLPKYKKINKEI